MHDSQIVRMLNDISTKEGGGVDLCPASMEKDIDAMNDFVYDKVSGSALEHPGGAEDDTCPRGPHVICSEVF